jgi:hypothetical protein
VETVENFVFSVFLVAIYLLYRIYIENARLFTEKPTGFFGIQCGKIPVSNGEKLV